MRKFAGFFAAVVLWGGVAYAQQKKTTVTTPPGAAVAVASTVPAGTRYPDAEWLKEYNTFIARNTALDAKRQSFAKTLQPEVDYLTGLSQRLIQGIPAGYQFNAQLKAFTLIPPQPAPTTPASPVAPTATPEVKESK